MAANELTLFLLLALPAILVVVAIIDLVKSRQVINKLFWALIILLLPLLGPVLYFFYKDRPQ